MAHAWDRFRDVLTDFEFLQAESDALPGREEALVGRLWLAIRRFDRGGSILVIGPSNHAEGLR